MPSSEVCIMCVFELRAICIVSPDQTSTLVAFLFASPTHHVVFRATQQVSMKHFVHGLAINEAQPTISAVTKGRHRGCSSVVTSVSFFSFFFFYHIPIITII